MSELAIKGKIPALSVGKFTVTEVGLVIDGIPEYKEWETFGNGLARVGKAYKWCYGDWLAYGEGRGDWGEMYTQAVDEIGADNVTLRKNVWVCKEFQLYRRRYNLKYSHHEEVASLEIKDQEHWLDWAENNNNPRTAKELRHEVQLWKRDKSRQANIKAMTELGRFNIIYCDPPWRYDYSFSNSRAIERFYPTMEMDELFALAKDVKTIAADNSLIFMWCPPAFARKAIILMRVWGFSYRTCMVWVKPSIGAGQWVRQRHELLMLGRRGNWPTPDGSLRPDSVIDAARLGHSEKPKTVYKIIEEMYPGVRRIELFARQKREGWVSWGDQIIE